MSTYAIDTDWAISFCEPEWVPLPSRFWPSATFKVQKSLETENKVINERDACYLKENTKLKE